DRPRAVKHPGRSAGAGGPGDRLAADRHLLSSDRVVAAGGPGRRGRRRSCPASPGLVRPVLARGRIDVYVPADRVSVRHAADVTAAGAARRGAVLLPATERLLRTVSGGGFRDLAADTDDPRRESALAIGC